MIEIDWNERSSIHGLVTLQTDKVVRNPPQAGRVETWRLLIWILPIPELSGFTLHIFSTVDKDDTIDVWVYVYGLIFRQSDQKEITDWADRRNI